MDETSKVVKKIPYVRHWFRANQLSKCSKLVLLLFSTPKSPKDFANLKYWIFLQSRTSIAPFKRLGAKDERIVIIQTYYVRPAEKTVMVWYNAP